MDTSGLRLVLKRPDSGAYWNGRDFGWGKFDALLSYHVPQTNNGRWCWTYDLPPAEHLHSSAWEIQLVDIHAPPPGLLTALSSPATRSLVVAEPNVSIASRDASIQYCYTARPNQSTLSAGTRMSKVAKALEEAVKDLYFISETDAPLEVVFWPGDGKQIDEKMVAQLAQISPDVKIEVVDVDDFFAPATEEQDWHNEEEKAQVERFQQLVKILKEQLQNAKAYRFGETKISVYIVGNAEDGLVGVKTVIVES